MFLIFNFVVFFKKNILLTWFGKHAWKKRKKNFYRNPPGVIYIQIILKKLLVYINIYS